MVFKEKFAFSLLGVLFTRGNLSSSFYGFFGFQPDFSKWLSEPIASHF